MSKAGPLPFKRVPKDARASIAVDLGAESCRISILRWVEGYPQVALVHRFPNGPIKHNDGILRWPLQSIEAGIDAGMQSCAALAPEGVRSVAIDGWAVDYVRVNDDGLPLADPFCYRDERTIAAELSLHQKISPARMGEITGVQQLWINTIYQLYADSLNKLPPGRRWLNLPEYMLTRWGAAPFAEYTNATHTQLVDLDSHNWSREIAEAAGIDLEAMPRIVPPGTLLCKLDGPLRKLTAFRDTHLIAPACHDTSSAVAGIPASGDDWAYISSGTWSLVGALTSQPLNSPAVREDHFTNLGAVGGKTCFHKSVNGMWLIRQCMGAWSIEGVDWDIEELLLAAQRVGGSANLILDVDDPDLLLVGQMPRRINDQIKRSGGKLLDESPSNAPAFISLILHSLAARYAEVLEKVEEHSNMQLRRLFIVGGGSRNSWLNQLTETATGLKVLCGPAESSTIGNLAIQLACLEESESSTSEAFGTRVTHWASVLYPLS